MRKLIIVPIFVLFLCFPTYLLGITNKPSFTDSTSSIFQKIVAESYNEIILEADMTQLLEINKEDQKQSATLTLLSAEGKQLILGVNISLRGVFRKQFCDMPPLKLNFIDKELRSMDLNPDFDKLKLVTHCVTNNQSTQTLLREYHVYQLYNQVTPNSFKVHLIKITYKDTKTNTQEQNFAFLIENEEELAARLGGAVFSGFGLTPSKLNKASLHSVMMFNYMIGNLDWNISRQQNVKFIQQAVKKELLLIPYDFDFCALVAPPYIRTNPDFNQKSVKERFCIGKFNNEEELNKTVANFFALKSSYLDCLRDSPYINAKTKKNMIKYLESFYKPLKNKKKLKANFM